MTPGEFVITLICIGESSFLAWGWLCGGFRRVNIPPCNERLAYLEREISGIKEQIHELRNTVNRVALWVDYQRALLFRPPAASWQPPDAASGRAVAE